MCVVPNCSDYWNARRHRQPGMSDCAIHKPFEPIAPGKHRDPVADRRGWEFEMQAEINNSWGEPCFVHMGAVLLRMWQPANPVPLARTREPSSSVIWTTSKAEKELSWCCGMLQASSHSFTKLLTVDNHAMTKRRTGLSILIANVLWRVHLSGTLSWDFRNTCSWICGDVSTGRKHKCTSNASLFLGSCPPLPLWILLHNKFPV